MKRLRSSHLLPGLVIVGLSGVSACNRTDEATGHLAVMTVDAACSGLVDGGVDPVAATAGQQLVAQLHCAGCHSSAFSGQPGKEINGGYPSNITPDSETGIGCLDDQTVATAILDGVGAHGPLCGMPKYRSRLAGDAGFDPEAAAKQIVQYLRTLAPVAEAVMGPCAASVPDGG
jgi:mono/diheme cytochrome c family protein